MNTMPIMAFDAFISYSNMDKATADAACVTLESSGVRCWIAPRDVPPGSEWAAAIVGAIDHCQVIVLIFSSQANISNQIRREVERAVSKGIPIIPLRIEEVNPTSSMEYFLGSIHWLDALTPPLEKHLERLAETVKSCLDFNQNGSDAPARSGTAQPAAVSPNAIAAILAPLEGAQHDASKAVAPIVTGVGALLTWLTAGSKVGPALAMLFSVLVGICGLTFTLIYRRYLGILGAGAQPEGFPERQAYDDLRESLAGGNLAARLYVRWLTAFLDAVDRFFGDAGLADRTLFPHAFGLKKPAALWTAPAFDRCLFLSLVYPIATIFFTWAVSGHAGPAEAALGLQPNLPGWLRGVVVAVVGFEGLALWRFAHVQSITRLAVTVAVAAVGAAAVAVVFGSVGAGAGAFAVALATAVASAGRVAGAVSVAVAVPAAFAFATAGASVGTFALVFVGAGGVAGGILAGMRNSDQTRLARCFLIALCSRDDPGLPRRGAVAVASADLAIHRPLAAVPWFAHAAKRAFQLGLPRSYTSAVATRARA